MPFKAYLAELRKNLHAGASERSYYPALKTLLESLGPPVDVFLEYGHIEVGHPDFEVRQHKRGAEFPIGWIESKLPGEDLNQIEKDEQLKRYRRLPNLILTDFIEFRLYEKGKRILTAHLATLHKDKLSPDEKGEAEVRQLLEQYLRAPFVAPRNPKELAKWMAGLAHIIRDITLKTFHAEPETGELHAQYEAFKQTLIPDLKPDQFADMYAQTIAYGLFAARCQPLGATETFTREKAAYLIPKTNPFLQKLFLHIAGPTMDDRLAPFVDHLTVLLARSDFNSILAEFGKRAAKEDPVVHFYEDFLREYDPKEKKIRGVYYTPEPVVLYIVRSIDHLLKTRFNKPDGLADPNVLILDPACGTGTFLYYVIRHIYDHLCAKGQQGAWNSYVSQNLLKRVFGFELLMAPYAVAHLKLALLLEELGYKFDTDERLGIYLTNTLEEAIKKSEIMFAQWIADEANAAVEIKNEMPIMVVLGNPPYSGHSANRSWVMLEDPKTKKERKVLTFIGQLLQDYYKVDGKPLGEKNPKWLQDDYVKFIRFAQWRIEQTGSGVVGLITNHSYLDNPTFRGMRQSLLNTFAELHFLDLHGGFRKGEVAPDGGPDKNVFDIQQGVAIALLSSHKQGESGVCHAEAWGTREAKHKLLSGTAIDSTPWSPITPQPPQYLFVPGDTALEDEFKKGWSVKDVFGLECLGIQTHRDSLTVAHTPDELLSKLKGFADEKLSDVEAAEAVEVGDVAHWKVRGARSALREKGVQKVKLVRYAYRPFDFRALCYDDTVVDRLRPEVMPHLMKQNLALNTMRQTKRPDWRHGWVTNSPSDAFVVEIKDGATTFPLYLYDLGSLTSQMPGGHTSRRANFVPEFISAFEKAIGLSFLPDGAGNLTNNFGPEDAFAYFYSVLWSPSYQSRYLSLLRRDFPRVPLTSDKNLFRALVEKGRELVSLHLMEAPKLADFITRYPISGSNTVEKVRFEFPPAGQALRHDIKLRASRASTEGAGGNPDGVSPPTGHGAPSTGRVYINKDQYFDGVPKDVWEFHIGGYQVCEKWLKDRKGRQLSNDDINHYQKIVVALHETIRLMKEIDEVIPRWPLP